MVDWKIYIDSPLNETLFHCYGSLDEGDGWGICPPNYGGSDGDGFGDGEGNTHGDGRHYEYGWHPEVSPGGGRGFGDDGYGWGNGDGGSATKW